MTGDNPSDPTPLPKTGADSGSGQSFPDQDSHERFIDDLGDVVVAQILACLARPPEESAAQIAAREAVERQLFERLFSSPSPWLIGRYRLNMSEPIDIFGSTSIHNAYDPKLQRTVLLSCIARSNGGRHQSPEFDTLTSAIRTAARIRHPNVVEIYDFVLHEGALYIVTPDLPGVTLEQWLNRKDRTWKEILQVFVDAGRGLSALHEHGVCHGGFEPSRVLMDPTERAQLTEFVRGDTSDRGEFTPQDDQRTFCIALYRALFRMSPFDGAGERPRSPVHRRGVPRSIVRLIMQGLEPPPIRRHRSMGELLRCLEARAEPRRCMRRAAAAFSLGCCLTWLWSGEGAPCPTGEASTPEAPLRTVRNVERSYLSSETMAAVSAVGEPGFHGTRDSGAQPPTSEVSSSANSKTALAPISIIAGVQVPPIF